MTWESGNAAWTGQYFFDAKQSRGKGRNSFVFKQARMLTFYTEFCLA